MSRIRRAAMPSLAEMGVVPFQDPGAQRFLFVVPPLPGHVEPTVALGAELVRRGHQVAWAGHPAAVTPLLEPAARLFPTRDKGFATRLGRARDARLRLRGPAALRFLWEDFLVPLGHGMVPGIEAAVQQFRPDVIVSDQRTPAGAVVAVRHGLPWATSACTSAAFGPALPGLPQADEWVTSQLAAFQRAHGLEEPVDLRWSGHLVIGFTAAGLVGDPERFPGRVAGQIPGQIPGQVVFAGPVSGPPAADDFPWEWLEPSVPTVLVSLGVPHGPAEARFAGIAADAVGELGLRAVLVAPPGALDPPPHVLVRERVPLPRLLPHLSAVVTHGGHDTVCAALAHGLPLVVAPARDEDPVLAHQVAAAGAGVTVRFARSRVDELGKALTAVLSDQTYRSAAQRVQSSLAAAGGVGEAADRLEKAT